VWGHDVRATDVIPAEAGTQGTGRRVAERAGARIQVAWVPTFSRPTGFARERRRDDVRGRAGYNPMTANRLRQAAV